jgi:hypothetical protein
MPYKTLIASSGAEALTVKRKMRLESSGAMPRLGTSVAMDQEIGAVFMFYGSITLKLLQ